MAQARPPRVPHKSPGLVRASGEADKEDGMDMQIDVRAIAAGVAIGFALVVLLACAL
jgi:hypothetical protein